MCVSLPTVLHDLRNDLNSSQQNIIFQSNRHLPARWLCEVTTLASLALHTNSHYQTPYPMAQMEQMDLEK